MKYYVLCLKEKYADFSGRSRRTEYWMFMLFNFIFAIIAVLLDYLLESPGIIYGLYGLATLIPGIAVLVRRLHDIGKSGLWFFISLIPIIGVFWLLILLLTDSQAGNNDYGANPKN